MSKFILVHDVPTGNPIVLHSEEIRVIKKSELYEGASAIHSCIFDDNIAPPFIHVAETPEKIYEMLNN